MELHKLENYDIEFIDSLIKNEIEESINIDFKAAEAPPLAQASRLCP